MDKKLQIFISSTYLDLKEERQSAVEAILSSGHIPAGMELFSAGDESQLEVIKRWIDDSDIYLLILGGRYGTVEEKSQQSYIQLEFEYALSKNIPLFSLIISEEYLDRKVREKGKSVLELDNAEKYHSFKSKVTSKIVEFFNDTKDIQLAIHKTLRDFENRFEFEGWISGKSLKDNTELIKQNSTLISENRELKEKVEYLNSKTGNISGSAINEKITKELKSTYISIPENVLEEFSGETEISVYDILVKKKEHIEKGISNASNARDLELFVLKYVVPKLIIFGIMKEKNLYGKSFERYVLTESGVVYIQKQIIN